MGIHVAKFQTKGPQSKVDTGKQVGTKIFSTFLTQANLLCRLGFLFFWSKKLSQKYPYLLYIFTLRNVEEISHRTRRNNKRNTEKEDKWIATFSEDHSLVCWSCSQEGRSHFFPHFWKQLEPETGDAKNLEFSKL